MKITLLGTGTSQGVPVIGCDCEVCRSVDFRDKRLRTSASIEVDGQHLVIDTGPDFRQQMLRLGATKLDAVLFTHQHKDHTAGMDDIRPFYFQQKQDIPIYASRPVIDQLHAEFAYVFAAKKYPGVASVAVNEITNNSFMVGPTEVLPVQVMHHKLPVFGFRIQDFAYITDANFISEEEMDKLKNLDVLVLNALQKTEHISHFTLEQALATIEKLRPKKAYLTHLSHRMGLHSEVSKILPQNVEIGYDGLEIIL